MQKVKEYEISKGKLMIEQWDRETKTNKSFCNWCRRWMPKDTGRKIVSKDKLTFKWKCKACLENN